MYNIAQKLTAEFIGTFALIFFGAGAVCAYQFWHAPNEAIAAAFLLKAIVPDDTWRAVALGTPLLTRDVTRLSGIILEGVATFFLVLTFFGTAVDERSPSRSIAGFAIGLSITLGILVAGPFTGGALNPARAFGPAVASSPGHWANHGVYWIGPLAGGFVAGLLYDSLFLKKP